MKQLITPLLLFLLSIAGETAFSQNGLSAIREKDIHTDLHTMADDHFRGREAGTLDELKVSMWLADQARMAGLQPAGDDGTYFQFFSMWRNRIASGSHISIGDQVFPLWTEALVPQTAPATVNAPILFIEKEDTNRTDIKGKAIALLASPEGINLQVSLPLRRYPTLIARKYAAGLLAKGAAAVIFIADSLIEAGWALNASYFDHGTYDIAGGSAEWVTPKEPVIWLHKDALSWVRRPGQELHAAI
ncbi:MAG: hypothetical protein ABUL46_03775, partial [Chitinophaga rupis]